MRFLLNLAVISLAFALAGCGNESAPTPPAPAETPAKPAEGDAPVATPSSTSFDIGDVESYTLVKLTPAPESASDNAKVDIMESPNKGISMVTVDMQPPYPAEFWLDCMVHAVRDFRMNPVVIRGMVYRDGAVVGDVKGVLGVDQVKSGSQEASSRVDAFFGIVPAPGDSILIHAEVEALLMPPGTDGGALDPLTAQADAESSTLLMGNPLRINFLAE